MIIAMVVGLGIAFADKPTDEDGTPKGNGFPSGPHFELGLIGRPNTYTGNGADGNGRHNIFIPLDTSDYSSGVDSTGTVDGTVRIFMTQDNENDFLVVDGDATGDGIAELNIAPGHYQVFARALGKPGNGVDTGIASIDGYFTYWYDEGISSDAIWLGGVDLSRVSGKPTTKNISKLFYYSGTITFADTTTATYNNKWIFDVEELNEYWWNIDNKGIKRIEIRFYLIDDPDYVPPRVDRNPS